MNDIFKDPDPYYAKMINVTFPGVDISKDMNIIKTEAELYQKIGKSKKIVKANKNTLLIETMSRQQAQKLLTVFVLAGNGVKTEEHRQ